MRRVLISIWAMALAAAAVGGAGSATVQAEPPLVGEISSLAYEYLPPEITVVPKTLLHYTNLDPIAHNVVSIRNGPKGLPLFGTETIGAATTVPIKGTEKLGAGVYDYLCTIHPEMTGTVYVELPSG